ncbi:hypothetical protein LAHI110946_12450 [Lactococcus hircilactis]
MQNKTFKLFSHNLLKISNHTRGKLLKQHNKKTVSSYFNLNKTQSELEFLDVRLDTDVRLYIDPAAFIALDNNWGQKCTKIIKDYFQKVINYIKQGNKKKASDLLSGLREPNEIHLGNSLGPSNGKGVGDDRAKKLYDALSESKAVSSGLLEDLEDTAFMIDGIGPDMISDIIANIIRKELIEFTQKMCKKYDIPKYEVNSGPILNLEQECWENIKVELPGPESPNGRYEKLILIPKDIVCRTPSYEARKFNNDNIIPLIVEKEFEKGFGRLLNGSLKPYTKRTIKDRQKGRSIKSINRDFIKENPEVLLEYKKHRHSFSRMSDEEIFKIIDELPAV